jgi:septum formation protein
LEAPRNHLPAPRLILGSTSKYRRALLDRFGIPFDVAAPNIDESRNPGESPLALVERLSRQKADAVAAKHPESLIISSDQVAVLDERIFGKPGSPAGCTEQLRAASGRTLRFLTGVHVLDARSGARSVHVDTTSALFRTLTDAEIERYIARENPIDCAGSFKGEALGITLLERIDSQDPTALTGLPLIWLASALRQAGLLLP